MEPYHCILDLYSLKHSLIEQGLARHSHSLECFHASEDAQSIRDAVFDILRPCDHFSIYSIIVEKNKVNPTIRDTAVLYPKIYESLLKYVLLQYSPDVYSDLVIFTDAIPLKKKLKEVEKALKTTISKELPPGHKFTILHHQSKSHYYLQIADYCSWAVYVKWERGETRPISAIASNVRSEFDIYQKGKTKYY